MSNKNKQLQAIFGDSSDSESDEDLFKSLNAGGSDDDDSSSSSSDDSSSEDEVERRPKKRSKLSSHSSSKRKSTKPVSRKQKQSEELIVLSRNSPEFGTLSVNQIDYETRKRYGEEITM